MITTIVILSILAIPTILFLLFMAGVAIQSSYYAAEITWFYIMVLWHVRKQPENYEYLDYLYVTAWRLSKDFITNVIYGCEEVNYVKSKTGTTYYFQGWRRPIIVPNSAI